MKPWLALTMVALVGGALIGHAAYRGYVLHDGNTQGLPLLAIVFVAGIGSAFWVVFKRGDSD